jgi:hypothetical protein
MAKATLLLAALVLVGCYPLEEYRGDLDSCSGDVNVSSSEAWLLLDRGFDDPPGWFGYEVANGAYLTGRVDRLEESGNEIRFDVEWEDEQLDGEVVLERDGEDLKGDVTLSQSGQSTECDLDLNWRRP